MVLRKTEEQKTARWKKIIDSLTEQGIISVNFTGDLVFSFNRGGVSGCKKVEIIK